MKINFFMDKSVQELKEMFPNSEFLEEKFDNAVMGVMPKSNRIVYHETEMIYTLVNELDEGFDEMEAYSDEWCDLYDWGLEYLNSEYANYFNNCKNITNPKICRDNNLLCKSTFQRPKSDSISSDESLLEAS